jgi:flagellar assembly protein FliH
MSSSPEHGRSSISTLTAERAKAAVPAYLDADLRTSPYAGAAVATQTVDPRMVDRRLQPAFLAAVAEASVQGHAEGRIEGYAAGLAEGRATAAQERAVVAEREHTVQQHQERLVSQAVSALNSGAHAALMSATPAFEALEDAVIDAAVQIAGMLIGQALPADMVAVSALRRALSLAESSGPMQARMHPDSAAIVASVGTGDDRIRITADPNLAPADCILEDGHSLIDATLSTAIERVRRELGRPSAPEATL